MARKYMRKKASDSVPQAGKALSQEVSKNPGMSMETMRSMLMGKAMEDRSHRIDLPDAMREKMESAFGMNFGKVNLYESESVADAGAQAIARGGNIAFAPGKADFNSLSGQSLLGHELSHIAAQARGEVTGSGFLNNGALEARADREGAMAAQGEQVYDGPVMDAPSFAGASAPMQAKPPAPSEYIEKMLSIQKALTAAKKLKENQDFINSDDYKKGTFGSGGDMKEVFEHMSAPKTDHGIDEGDYAWFNTVLENPTPELIEALNKKQEAELEESKFRFDNRIRPMLPSSNEEGPHYQLGDSGEKFQGLSQSQKGYVGDKTVGSYSTRHGKALIDLMLAFDQKNKGKEGYTGFSYGNDAQQVWNADKIAEDYGMGQGSFSDKNIEKSDLEDYEKESWQEGASSRKAEYVDGYAQDYLNYKRNWGLDMRLSGEQPEAPMKEMYGTRAQVQKQMDNDPDWQRYYRKAHDYYTRDDDLYADGVDLPYKNIQESTSDMPILNGAKMQLTKSEKEELRKQKDAEKLRKQKEKQLQKKKKPEEHGASGKNDSVKVSVKKSGKKKSGEKKKDKSSKIKYDENGIPQNYANGERITTEQQGMLMDLLGRPNPSNDGGSDSQAGMNTSLKVKPRRRNALKYG